MTNDSLAPSGEVSVKKFSHGVFKSNRTSIIQHLIQQNRFSSYLELGVRDFKNFDQIVCAEKIAVDPFPFGADQRNLGDRMFEITSDQFFDQLDDNKNFDLIFIDGLHLAEQVERDIEHALNHLNKGGIIVMHDCNPPTEFHQREVYKVDGKYPPWNGTTWKAFAKNRMVREDLKMSVVNTDWGVGLIGYGEQKIFPYQEQLDWSLLNNNRADLLNLISVDQFLAKY